MDRKTEGVISDMIKKFPNDQDLGREYRNFILCSKLLDEFCKKYPNDFDLGKEIRKNN